ncbi:NUDIX domain-containing protein [Nitrobacter winogradskyi]|uniref:8-oxo-dGTP pyrophosphatase MutT (NUDIX family) n=1 Tax=Nitrobacter winogradskyi TaxID=913 RepID=A0ACC6AP86_NITWI|nr:NUDIX domain-containing protein [Nitrobacter winogradskyi]MCP2000805.1 8-oxo-dGTP pyrophosphatase MutT (NUDIX family) [Nitrobacter winogradskyi]
MNEIWQREKQLRSHELYNGQLFSIDHCDARTIVGWISEYRYFLAQRREPSLHAALKIKPLAVTGILSCPDGVLFGRRSDRSEMDAGCWELVPSGGVDDTAVGSAGRVSIERSVLTELEEETGIGASELSAHSRAVALVEDPQSHVTDVGIMLATTSSAAQIRRRFAALEKREYSELEIVAPADVGAFRRARVDSLGAVSAALLDTLMQPGLRSGFLNNVFEGAILL